MKPLLGQSRPARREQRGDATKIILAVVMIVVVGLAYNTFVVSPVSRSGVTTQAAASGIFSRGFILTDIDGNRMPLSDYAGKVILAVNVASLCGYTKANYEQLVKLHEAYAPSGLVIMAFPCNQFGNQEPGSNAEVKSFAQSRGAQFLLMNKIMVNGPQTNDLWAALKSEMGISEIKWNFEKFVIDRRGKVIAHHASSENPLSFEREIVTALQG